MGLQEPFAPPKQPEIGFGFPQKPQIGLTLGGVGRTETSTQFAIGTGTELEAIKTFGTISDVTKIGTTVIKGQGVDIYSFSVSPSAGAALTTLRSVPQTTAGGEFVSGYGLLSSALFAKSISPSITTPETTPTISVTTEKPISSIPISPPKPSPYLPSISKISPTPYLGTPSSFTPSSPSTTLVTAPTPTIEIPSFTPPAPSVSYASIQRLNYPMTTPLKRDLLLRKLKLGVLSAKAYKTYFLRKGKRVYLPGVSLRGEAIRKGERKAVTSIAATFGIEPTNVQMPGIESQYKPSPVVFRGYKIRGKAKIPLEDQWIQKAGTRAEKTIRGARLASRSEVAELQSFRKARKGRFFR